MEKELLIEAEKILKRHDVSVVIEAYEILESVYDDYYIPIFKLWWKDVITEEEFRILKKYFNDKKENK